MASETRCYLFIGGPLDGQVVDVGGRPGRYRHRWRAGGQELTAEYVLEPIEAERMVVLHLYREQSLRMAEVVLRLLAGYCDSATHAARLAERRNG